FGWTYKLAISMEMARPILLAGLWKTASGMSACPTAPLASPPAYGPPGAQGRGGLMFKSATSTAMARPTLPAAPLKMANGTRPFQTAPRSQQANGGCGAPALPGWMSVTGVFCKRVGRDTSMVHGEYTRELPAVGSRLLTGCRSNVATA